MFISEHCNTQLDCQVTNFWSLKLEKMQFLLQALKVTACKVLVNFMSKIYQCLQLVALPQVARKMSYR